MTTAPMHRFISPLAMAGNSTSIIRSLISELMKLRIRSITVTSLIQIVLFTGIIFMVTNPQYYDGGGVQYVFSGWSLASVTAMVTGALSVTSEYSSNTMRTTAISDPSRARAFLAKSIALFLYTFSVGMITALASMSVAYLRLSSTNFEIDGDGVLAILLFAVVLSCIALISMGFGYIVRSTAGAITIMVFLLYFSDLLRAIPNDFFKDTLPMYMLANVGSVIINPDIANSGWATTLASRTDGLLVLLAYVVVVCGLGLATYKSRDI